LRSFALHHPARPSVQRAGAFMIGWIMGISRKLGRALPAHKARYLPLLLAKRHDAQLEGV
jgi:hypothetical protein